MKKFKISIAQKIKILDIFSTIYNDELYSITKIIEIIFLTYPFINILIYYIRIISINISTSIKSKQTHVESN